MTERRKKKQQNKPKAKQPRNKPKASLGGETVEPRILLSATWIDGTSNDDVINGTAGDDCIRGWGGNDTLDGGAGNDLLDGGTGNDTLLGGDGDDDLRGMDGNDTVYGGAGNDMLWAALGNDVVDGGSGQDTVNYSIASSAVTVDVTVAGAQDTGGGGVDTLTSIEGVIGSTTFDDTFAFSNPVAGTVYTVDGGGGSNTIDLSGFASSAVTFGDGTITVDLGGGQSFQIDHSSVNGILFGDVNATVIAGNVSATAFTGSGIYIDGPQAFRVDVGGAGSFDWSYDTTTDTLTVADTTGTDASSSLSITDLNGTDLAVDKVTIDRNVGSLVSNVDIGTIESTSGNRTITDITIGGGTGTLGQFRFLTGMMSGDTTFHANVGTITLPGNIASNLVVNGDLGAITGNTLIGGSSLVVTGDAGTINLANVDGSLAVAGDVTSFTTGNINVVGPTFGGNVGTLTAADVNVDLTIAGDLGSATITGVGSGAAITVQSAVGVLDFRVNGVQHGGTFATPVTFVFDGSTGTVQIGARPTANAGADQVVNERDLVTLDGTASADADGDPLTYTWVQTAGPPVVLSNPNAAQPNFTAPEGLTNTSVSFDLQVFDGVNTSTADAVTIVINRVNDAPTAAAGPDQAVNEGDLVTLNGTGSADPEGQGLTYAWVQTAGPPVLLSNASAGQPTFTAPEGLTNTAVTFVLTVTDGVNTSSADSVTIAINADDDAPSADAGPDQIVRSANTVQLDARGQDPEGRTLTYAWRQIAGPAVVLSNGQIPNPTFLAPTIAADTAFTFEVAVSDGTTTSVDTVTVTVTATAAQPNAAPDVIPGASRTVSAGDSVLVSVGATDADGDVLTYTWTQVSGPPVMLSGATGDSASFVAPDVERPTDVRFQVDVSDGQATTTSFVSVSILPAAGETQPTADGPQGGSGETGSTGSAGTPVLPEMRPLEPATRAPTAEPRSSEQWDPTVENEPTRDGEPSADTTAAPTGRPYVDAGADQSVAEGALVRLGATTSGFPGQALKYEWTQVSGPPVALESANSPNPRFVAPNGEADYEAVFRVEVSDGASKVVDTLSVHVLAENDAPQMAPTNMVIGTAGTEIQLTSSIFDPDSAGLTYVWTQVGGTPILLPESMTRAPTIRLPEVFVEEELVFEVAVLAGDHRVTEQITVQVQPVASTYRDIVFADADGPEGPSYQDGGEQQPARGIGKIWAALLAFFSTGRIKNKP